MNNPEQLCLCDTNIIIEFYKNNSQIIQELKYIKPSNLAISVITKAELYFGAFNKAELEKIKRHLASILCIPVNTDVSQQFIQLMETYSLSHKLSIPDAIIAATSLVHNIKLYTLNKKDFCFITGIQIYNEIIR